MDNEAFKYALKNIIYALTKILVANDNKNYDAIDAITRQELKAIKEDLKNLEEGDKK